MRRSKASPGSRAKTILALSLVAFVSVATGWWLSVGMPWPPLVAVGYEADGDEMDGADWVSTDGMSWTPVAHDETVFGGSWISGVTSGGPGLVAVGYDDLPGDDRDGAVWVSHGG